MELKQSKLSQKLTLGFCLAVSLVLLYNWQRIFFLECTDGIISDMPGHIKLALGHNDYGLSSYIIRALYAVGDEHFAQTALSLVLAANSAVSIVTLWLLICEMFEDADKSLCLLSAVLANICAPWPVFGQSEIYLEALNANVLHNMTLLFSRTFIPLDFLFFFRIWKSKDGTVQYKSWLGMAVCFLLTTMFKPNFAFAFIPVLGVMLLYDLIKTRGKNLKNEIIIGMTVVPAGLACIWQYTVLFDENFAGNSSSVALRALSLGLLASLLVMYLRSLLLPVFASGFCLKNEAHNYEIKLIWICMLTAIAENVLLTETGFRANDGNFSWGSIAICQSIFAVSITMLFRMIKFTDRHNKRELIIALLGLLILLGHLIAGLYCIYIARHGGYHWFYF